MRIRLLGPAELLRADGSTAGLGAAKRRSVLAALALDLNRVVSMDRLLDVVWEGSPPLSAKAALQGHIAQLRKVLGDGVELVTRSPGYQLVADRSQLDVTRFEDLLAEARTATDAEAVELLRTALALRRGPVLADVPAERLRRVISARMEESVVTAIQELGRRLHRLGRTAEGIDLLHEAVALRPLREPLVELLVLSLHHAGRQAEALNVYHDTRTRLADELGVDPGIGLRQAFHTVLTAHDAPEPTAPKCVPLQLPRENRGFAGREAELAKLGPNGGADGAIRILVGPAGVGKTALALRWAHQVAARFPDGHLFADLRGFDETDPVAPDHVLTGFLRALGVPDARIPADADERAALYRSAVAGRRMLVVLDNARSAAQVRPLLPGTSSCAVLVSSRSRLDDLAATEGAVRVTVPALSRDEAVTVLGLVLGADRVAAEPAAAAELAELCDRLPLALRIAAARGSSHQHGTLRAMVEAFSDERHRLHRLSLPDSGSTVRTALAWSYRRLDAASARLFRRLGEHPGTDVDRGAAAALAGTTVAEVQPRLESLISVHLLHKSGPERYARHDLVRLYTAAVAEEEPAADRHAATERLLDYYLHTADAGRRLVTDEAWQPAMRVARPPAESPELSTVKEALDWFRAEETNLHRALALAGARGDHGRAWRLALCLERFQHHLGDLPAQAEAARLGLAAARELGDNQAQAVFHVRVGENLVRSGRAGDAVAHGEQAVRLGRDEPQDACNAMLGLGRFLHAAGRPAEALARLTGSIEVAGAVGNVAVETYALLGKAWVHQSEGERTDAMDALRRSVELVRDNGSRVHGAAVLLIAGELVREFGEHDKALRMFSRGLSAARDAEDLVFQARHHRAIGNTLAHLGSRAAAVPHWTRAERLRAALGLPDGGDVTLNGSHGHRAPHPHGFPELACT
ncbi:AfsR/SARP family transcriptional regulator [Saccharopolyspora erythraea]|uniref:AfsR/SARP family transcriptional regulator n=1 Tax=Saccharopolyspora erythraea TaxID=1836 RepID=UPI001E56525B|nr:AfsR/SARP family transcriptional regulator [Saccharopolyspora erythraea]